MSHTTPIRSPWTPADERLFRVMQRKAQRKEQIVCTIADASDAIEYEQTANCDHHCQAMQWAITLGEQGVLPTPEIILEIYARLFDCDPDWRTVNIHRPGWPVCFTAHEAIETAVLQLCAALEQWTIELECPFRIMARFHLYFEDIHPVRDGNGRLGRILLCMLAAYFDVGLIKITPAQRQEYFMALHLQRIDMLVDILKAAVC